MTRRSTASPSRPPPPPKFLRDQNPLDDAREHRVLPVERWLIGNADEKLRAGAVGPIRNQHRRHRAARVLLLVDLGLQAIQAAGAVATLGIGILRQRIAALDDALTNHAVEDGAVVAAVARGLDEVRDVIGRAIGEQVEHDRSRGRFDHRLLVAQFVRAVGVDEWRGDCRRLG